MNSTEETFQARLINQLFMLARNAELRWEKQQWKVSTRFVRNWKKIRRDESDRNSFIRLLFFFSPRFFGKYFGKKWKTRKNKTERFLCFSARSKSLSNFDSLHRHVDASRRSSRRLLPSRIGEKISFHRWFNARSDFNNISTDSDIRKRFFVRAAHFYSLLGTDSDFGDFGFFHFGRADNVCRDVLVRKRTKFARWNLLDLGPGDSLFVRCFGDGSRVGREFVENDELIENFIDGHRRRIGESKNRFRPKFIIRFVFFSFRQINSCWTTLQRSLFTRWSKIWSNIRRRNRKTFCTKIERHFSVPTLKIAIKLNVFSSRKKSRFSFLSNLFWRRSSAQFLSVKQTTRAVEIFVFFSAKVIQWLESAFLFSIESKLVNWKHVWPSRCPISFI